MGEEHFHKQCIAVHLRLTKSVNSSMHQHYILHCAHRAQVHLVTALAGVHGGGMEPSHDLLVKPEMEVGAKTGWLKVWQGDEEALRATLPQGFKHSCQSFQTLLLAGGLLSCCALKLADRQSDKSIHNKGVE